MLIGWSLGTTLILAILLQLAHLAIRNPHLNVFFQLVLGEDRIVLWASAFLLLVALAIVPLVRPAFIDPLLVAVDRYIVPISFVSFGAFGLAAYFVYLRFPLSMDEFSIVYQSRVFALGKLDGQVPPALIDRLVPPIFIIEFFGIDRARGLITSVYWPGTSLLMTPFAALGVPWLFNPCVSAATIFCLHRASREVLASPRIASWVTLFLLSSPVIALNAASYYAMPLHMLANVLFFWTLFRANTLREQLIRGEVQDAREKRFIFLAGVIGGFALIIHNPIPHFCFSLPWLLWMLAKRREWLLPLCAGYFVLALPLGVGWYLHLKSLDAQMPAMQGSILARLPRIFVFPSGELLIIRSLAVCKMVAWATPGLLVLSIWGWRRAWQEFWLRQLALSFLTLFFAYFFISYPQGHGWGYRFIHPAWFVLPLIAAYALECALHQKSDEKIESSLEVTDAERAQASRLSLQTYTRFLVSVIGLSLVVLTPLRAWQVHSFISRSIARLPVQPSTQKSVLFVNSAGGDYIRDLVQNDPFLRNLDWKLHAFDPTSDAKVAAQLLNKPRLLKKGKWGELFVEDAP